MEFGIEYQRELVSKLCSHKFMEKIGFMLNPDMFDSSLRDIVDLTLVRYRKKKQVLSRAQLLQLGHRVNVKIAQVSSGDFSFDEEEVLSFIKFRILREGLAKAHAYREAGKYEQAVYAVLECQKKFPSADENGSIDLLEGNRTMPIRRGLILTQLPTLDHALGMGVGAGDLAIMMAPTSGGKTAFLCYLAAQAFMSGKCVYYVTLEVTAEEIEAKLRRCILQTLTPKKQAWETRIKTLKRKKGRFILQEFPPNSINVHELETKIPQGTEVVFIDYADYVQPSSGRIGIEYQDLGNVYTDLKRIALERRLPIWSASQVNRKAYDKLDLETQDTESSLRKMMLADQVVTLTQDIAEREVDPKTGTCMGSFFIAKNRHGDRYVKIPVTINWGLCSFTEGRFGG